MSDRELFMRAPRKVLAAVWFGLVADMPSSFTELFFSLLNLTSCVDEVKDPRNWVGVFFLLKLKPLANVPNKNCDLLDFDLLKLIY
jgi:hypothetical protein